MKNATAASLFDDSELDAILNSLDAAEEPVVEASEDEVICALEEVSIDSDLKRSLMAIEVEEGELMVDPVEHVEQIMVPVAKAAVVRGSGVSSLNPSAALLKLHGEKIADGIELTKGELTPITAMDELAKKVKEKIVNVLEAAVRGTVPSVYTQRALALLKEHGSFSTQMLREDYLSRPYSPGTASAQSSQMMIALPALKIATRNGSTLTLNPDSTLFPILVAAMANPDLELGESEPESE